jgi:hypothetical protein
MTTAAILAALAAALPIGRSLAESRPDRQLPQQQILDIVHRLFPEAVPYIDVSGMVSSFPPAPLFPISLLSLSGYQPSGRAVLKEFIEARHPPLLIVNSEALDVWNGGAEIFEGRYGYSLLQKDKDAIRATYAHFWGLIYLAGHQWRDLVSGDRATFDLSFDGPYTLFASHPARVDGILLQPRDTIVLKEGPHQIETIFNEPDLRILLGSGLDMPEMQPSPLPVFPGLSAASPGS